MITSEIIKKVWESGNSQRLLMDKSKSYYNGTNRVSELMLTRSDGRSKTHIRTNWTKHIVDQHTGFVTTKPVQYSTTLDDNSGIQFLYDLVESNDLDTLDTEHFANCLLYGQSVEVHSYDGESIKIEQTIPYNWVFLQNEKGEDVGALYRVEVPANTIYNGEFVDKAKLVFYYYDSESITVFETDKKGELVETSKAPHLFGTIPVVRYQVQKDFKPFLDSAFFSTCDNYDIIRSAQADDIKYNVDSMMVMKGVDIKALLEKDDNGISTLEKLKTMGILPIDDTASVEWLTRNTDVEKFRFDLRVARASIHLMGCIPDLTDTVNANGASPSISGIALKIMFQGMIQKSGEFVKYFKKGLNRRVQLINNQASRLGFPVIQDYSIKIETNIPQSHIEWLQYLKNMEGVIPKFEIYKLLPFLDNPEMVYEEYLAEKSEKIVEGIEEEITPPENTISN